jgi:sec-independent protein translocase protein TatC
MSVSDLINPDARRTFDKGRKTASDMLTAARSKLRRVFIVFVVFLLATIYAMRLWVWPSLKQDLLSRGADVIVLTPFDVILLQAKLGILVGIIFCIPFFLYYSRDALKDRGIYPQTDIALWKLISMGLLSTFLFFGGIGYSYRIFFPLMFDFLAYNAVSAGLSPTYSIVDWTQFIFVLGFAFGLAAQLPLVMTTLSYTEIIPYETFRDKWKYAVLGMFAFGAIFSPPDPFTQIMWAAPLVVLYGFSLYLSKIAVSFHRGKDEIDIIKTALTHSKIILITIIITGVFSYWLSTTGVTQILTLVGSLQNYITSTPSDLLNQSWQVSLIPPFAFSILISLIAGILVLLYHSIPELEPIIAFGDPTAIDLESLDIEGLQMAPPEALLQLTEEKGLSMASRAIEVGDAERAQAILRAVDSAKQMRAVDMLYHFDEEEWGRMKRKRLEEKRKRKFEGSFKRATAGIVSSISEKEVGEEEIGGYAYDIAFLFDTLRSKTFRIFGVFITVLVSVFTFLYMGGIGTIKNDFLRRLPDIVSPEEVSIITLHPVEALIFEIKIATLLGLVATLPCVLYYMWPALKKRGIIKGDRNVAFSWAGAISLGLLFGSTLGYIYVAPAFVSYFVYDGIRANMLITYRVSNFFWLIFFCTVGIGLWIDIIVTMIMFHRAKLVSYTTMYKNWRSVTVGILVLSAVFTPPNVITMVLVTLPIMLAYGIGLTILWFYDALKPSDIPL